MYSKAECGQLVILINVPGKIGSLYNSGINTKFKKYSYILRNHTKSCMDSIIIIILFGFGFIPW